MVAEVVPYHWATILPQAPVAERPHVLPPEWQKEHSEVGSPLAFRQRQPLSDREVLGFLHRALIDIQRTSARTLAAVSESYDLIRFADNLSNPLYRSADTIRGSARCNPPDPVYCDGGCCKHPQI